MIRELRVKKGWSQEELAEFSGLSVRTVQRIEQGATPSRESLRALSSIFSVPQSELVSAKPVDLKVSATNAIGWVSVLIAALWFIYFCWGYREGLRAGIAYFLK